MKKLFYFIVAVSVAILVNGASYAELSDLKDNVLVGYTFDVDLSSDILGINDANPIGNVVPKSGSECLLDGCAQFPDKLGVIDLPWDMPLTPEDEYTFMIWFKAPPVTTNEGYNVLLGLRGLNCKYYTGFSIQDHYSGKIPGQLCSAVKGSDNNKYHACSETTVDDNEWHMALVTRSGTSWAAYLDGVKMPDNAPEVVSGVSTAGVTCDYDTGIGGNTPPTGYTYQRPYTGYVDDVYLFKRAVTEDEIMALYNGGEGLAYPFEPDIDYGLVAYYPFDGDTNDHKPSGTPLNGTPVDSINYVDGVKGQACYFDGDNSVILGEGDVFTADMQFASTGSVSMWFNGDLDQKVQLFSSEEVLSIGTGGFSTYGYYYLDGTAGNDCPWPSEHVSDKRVPSNDTWYHVVMTWDMALPTSENKNIKLYVDGAPVSEAPAINANTPVSLSCRERKTRIGASWHGEARFQGAIDEVRLYNRVLSETEIQGLYDQGNLPPIAEAGNDQAAHIGDVVTIDGSGSSDPDGNYPISYQWEILSKPEGSIASLSDPIVVNPDFTPDLLGEYIIQLTVTDTLGAISDPDIVLISTFNTPPVADAGPDQPIVQIGTTVQLDGSNSWDDDGDTIEYFWQFKTIPNGSSSTIFNPTSPTPSFIADTHADYVVELFVNDSWDMSEPDYILVSFDNVKPVADPGNSQSVLQGETVFLDGSGSSDANLDPLNYSWSIVTKPGGSTSAISDSTIINPNFIADLPGQYIVSLVVNDGFVDSDPDNITVTAISYQDALTDTIQDTIVEINNLPKNVFKNKNNKKTLTNKLNAVLNQIDNGQYDQALNKLENDILKKTNGCAENGTPDKNDWIQDCPSQNIVYPLVIDAINLLQNLV